MDLSSRVYAHNTIWTFHAHLKKLAIRLFPLYGTLFLFRSGTLNQLISSKSNWKPICIHYRYCFIMSSCCIVFLYTKIVYVFLVSALCNLRKRHFINSCIIIIIIKVISRYVGFEFWAFIWSSTSLRGYYTFYPKISKFCALSQNYQHLLKLSTPFWKIIYASYSKLSKELKNSIKI